MKIYVTALALMLACLSTLPASAGGATITFDGIETTLDPIGVSIGGVTVSYDGGGSGQAFIGELGPVAWGGVVLGDTIGTLSLAFARPTTLLGFDFALDAFEVDVLDGVLAELFSPLGTLLDIVAASAFYDDAEGLAVGQFLYEGGAIASASLFFDVADSNAFVLDNLTHQPVPEPSTMLLTGAGIIGWGVLRKRLKG